MTDNLIQLSKWFMVYVISTPPMMPFPLSSTKNLARSRYFRSLVSCKVLQEPSLFADVRELPLFPGQILRLCGLQILSLYLKSLSSCNPVVSNGRLEEMPGTVQFMHIFQVSPAVLLSGKVK